MFTLDATEEQLDYKTIYGSAKQGWMSHVWTERTDSIAPLLDAIIDEIPAPATVEGTPQMLITSLEYSPYVGRIAVGKVTRGSLRTGQNVTLAKRDGVTMQKTRIRDLMVFDGLGKKGRGGRLRRDLRTGGHRRIRDRRHDLRLREPRTAAAHPDRRTHDVDALHDQQLALLRQGRQIRHLAPYQGAARPRIGKEPRPARRSRDRTPIRSSSTAAACCTCRC